MDVSTLYNHFLKCSGVSIDTRTIKEGNLFFALKGDNFNGNKWVSKALGLGASLAIIDEEEFQGENCILVDDVLTTLQLLAKHHREQLSIPVIGLTGSNGKTTTKELIHQVLNAKYNTLATIGNLNNHIGVPLTLLRIKKEHEIAIIEMGANHQKEIEFLCNLAQPDYGYITNFGKAHLEGFGGIEGVIKGKSELYTYLRSNNKAALVNSDEHLQIEKSKGIRNISFSSIDSSSPYFFQKLEDTNSYLGLKHQGYSIQSHLTGGYNLSNLSAAITLGSLFKIEIQKIKEAIESYYPSNNRSQVTKTVSNTLVVDAYNANPSSMQAAIENFKEFNGESKWMILGDMFELGSFEKEEHQKIVDLISQNSSLWEKILLVGKAFEYTENQYDCFTSTEDLLFFLKQEEVTNKTVLIKGSRGMKLETSIPLL